jgi:nucleotide-binding universal stress UspA family protein
MTDPYRHILVPLDGSELAVQALPHARAIAERAKAQVTLLQVVPDVAALQVERSIPTTVGVPSPPLTPDPQLFQIQDDWLAQARAALDAQVQEMAAVGINATSTVEIGEPGPVILAFAKNHQADLIVLCTHGRSGMARWLYGSVATHVLQRAACPVLIIRNLPAPTTAPATGAGAQQP